MYNIVFNYFFYILLLMFILPPLHVFAFKREFTEKPLRFEHLSIEDGLSYPNIYGIFQDHRKFLWFATKYGLNKYDGMDCTVYTHDPYNANSLSVNYTWNLFEDSVGNLWVVTYGGGIDLFDPKTESFSHYQHDPGNSNSLGNDFVWCIFEDSKKKLWIGTDDGLDYFDPDTNAFIHYRHDPDHPNSLSNSIVTMITEDEQGYLWLGTYGGGLNRFDRRTKSFIHYRHIPKQSNSLSDDKINFVYIDRQKTLWVGTGRGLNKLFLSSYMEQIPENRFIHYFHDPNDMNSLTNNRVRHLYEEKNGTVWFATSGGLSRYNKQDNNFVRYQLENDNPNSLSHNSLYFVTGDYTGTLWIGTANGVDKLDPGNQQFDIYLSGAHIHSIYETAKGIFTIGTNAGLKYVNIYDNNHQSSEYKYPLNFSEAMVTKIVPDNNGQLWMATMGEGLYRCNSTIEACNHYQYDPDDTNSLNNNTLLDIAVSANGILWIALSDSGVDRFDPKNGIFKHYTHEIDNQNSLSSNWTRTICIDSRQQVWIGTESGVSRFNPKNKKFVNYYQKKNKPGSLSDNIVNMIIEDRKKNIWIATNGGLNQFNPSSDNFTIYRTKNGLPGNSISAILEDNSGFLWVSTNNGLSKFDPTRKTFRNYDQLDGLQGKQFIYHSAWKSRDGKLYFGGTNGLNAFDPEKLMDNPVIPPVYLTDFRLFNQSVPIGGDSPLQHHISFTKQITLSHEQTVFSFDFVALNYRASKKNQYAYFLEGFDKDWIYTNSSHRTAKYTNLNPGSYIFRVKASNNDGIWNDNGVSLNITILPAWWMTWWFKGLLFFCFSGVGFGIYYWRLRAIQYQNIKLEKRIKERTHALKESQGRYQELFDTINSGVCVFEVVDHGNDFIIREFNRAGEKIEGVKRSDVLGKKVTIAFPGVIDSEIVSMLKDVWHNGGIKYFSPVLYKNETGESWRENYIYKLPSNEVVSVYNDVTERVNSEIELRQAKKRAEASDKAKSQFLTHMSHELRTPLNGILGYTQFLRKGNGLSTEQIEGLNVIHKCGEHLFTLINDILDLAKVEAGKLELYPSPIVLSTFLANVAEIMKIAAHQKGIQFLFEPSKNLPDVITLDAKRLRQVLLNLLGNAIKFTDKGYVLFKIESKKSYNNQIMLQFEIQDTGVGINPEQLSTIFKPFEQVGDVGKYIQGTGLGLSISHQLVGLMQGDIQVNSDVGKGSTFLFEISVFEANQAASESQKKKTFKEINKDMTEAWNEAREKAGMFSTTEETISDTNAIITPPLNELKILYDLARFGSMELIQQRAKYLENLDEKYIPFARKLHSLSAEFEDELVVSMVKQCME
ncbi:MAG: hypothetical protein HQK75_15755 [Candidatus Magnetomorum sp.]|nr:hypothetical protein [Candidatus Magnetomorum sp.]